ncbi:MAG: DUF4350 domain-containing protein [Candidatus Eremiobacteraeota bacterium]|nr:DUF4350 domain-containing protein [Candidatus Eremiobacteraeota bacterium]
MMNKGRILSLVCAITAIVLLLLLGGKQGDGTVPVNNSVHSTSRWGGKVYYLLLEKLGCRPSIAEVKLSCLGMEAGTVIILSPLTPYDSDELIWLRSFVHRGGVLLVADIENNDVFRIFGFTVKATGDLASPEEVAPVPSASTAGVAKAMVKTGIRLTSEDKGAFEPLLADGRGTIMAMKSYGSGKVIATTAPEIFSNEMIRRADNAILSVHCLRTAPPGKALFFDEYHHGFSDEKSFLSIIPLSVKLLLLQVIILILMLLYSVSRRCSAPVPLSAEAGRGSFEYVATMAGIYQKAQARHSVLSMLVRNFRRTMARLLGISPESPDEVLAERMAERLQADQGKIGAVLAECQTRLKGKALDEKTLLGLAKKLAAAGKEE